MTDNVDLLLVQVLKSRQSIQEQIKDLERIKKETIGLLTEMLSKGWEAPKDEPLDGQVVDVIDADTNTLVLGVTFKDMQEQTNLWIVRFATGKQDSVRINDSHVMCWRVHKPKGQPIGGVK